MKKLSIFVLFASLFLSSHAEAPTTLQVGGLTFTLTDHWELKQTPRPMSSAGIRWKAKEGSGPEADFYHFGAGQGGGVQANLDRWKAQFQPDANTKVEQRTIGNRTWHYVHIDGTFLQGRPFGPKTPVPDQRMLGAIIEDAGGTVFVKLVDGQTQVTDALIQQFIHLVESVR